MTNLTQERTPIPDETFKKVLGISRQGLYKMKLTDKQKEIMSKMRDASIK